MIPERRRNSSFFGSQCILRADGARFRPSPDQIIGLTSVICSGQSGRTPASAPPRRYEKILDMDDENSSHKTRQNIEVSISLATAERTM